MAIPEGWAFSYVINNVGGSPSFGRISDARGICPHCAVATTFQIRSLEHDISDSRTNLYIILFCNFASCRKTLYVQTSFVPSFRTPGSVSQDPFFVHPSRAIEPAHRSIPTDIADDWLEAQRSFAGENPKATAMMLRRVLYGILLHKGCRLRPLKDGVQDLIAGQRLPAVFDDWLPAIQDDGHDAAHPDRALKVSTENVAETMEYTAELLRYLYIEPFEFQQRKARNASTKPATPALAP